MASDKVNLIFNITGNASKQLNKIGDSGKVLLTSLNRLEKLNLKGIALKAGTDKRLLAVASAIGEINKHEKDFIRMSKAGEKLFKNLGRLEKVNLKNLEVKSNATENLEKMSGAISKINKQQRKLAKQHSKTSQVIVKENKKSSKSFLKMGKALPIAGFISMAGAAIVVKKALSFAVSESAKFEQSMANVKSVANPTAEEFKNLSLKARELGRSTSKSAIEIAGAQLELSKLGFTASEITGSLEGVVNLTEATGEEIAKSAETVASTLRQFGLEASQSSEIVDIMTKSFSESALNLERYSEAMKFAGAAAKASGVGITTTIGALEELSNNAINGTMAGNALKRMFIDLGTDSSKASEFLTAAGVDGAATFTEKLHALNKAGLSFGDIAEMFGKVSATSAQILIQGAASVDKFDESLQKATGTAKEMAAVRMDTLIGDVKLLESAYSDLSITLGKSTFLRSIIQDLTKLTTGLGLLASGKATDEFREGFADFGVEVAKANGDLKLTASLIEKLIDIQETGGEFQGMVISAADAQTQLRMFEEIEDKEADALEALKAKGKELGFNSRILDDILKTEQESAKIVKGAPVVKPSKLGGSDGTKKFKDFEGKSTTKTSFVPPTVGDFIEAEEEAFNQRRVKLQEHIDEVKVINEEAGLSDIDLLKKRKAEELLVLTEHGLSTIEVERSFTEQISQIKEEEAKKEAERQKAVRVSVIQTSGVVIDAGFDAAIANTKSAKKQQKLALAQIAVSGAVASGKVWADLGWPAAIAPQIQIAAQTASQLAIVGAQKFEKGGVVGGTSFTGDNVPAQVNSGEMILNRQQQSNLFSQLQGGSMGGSGGGVTINVSDSVIGEQSFIQKVVDAVSNSQSTSQPVWNS